MFDRSRAVLAMEQYSQTLIATAKEFIPSGQQIETFLSMMLELNVVPGDPKIGLRIRTGKIREYPFVNPFTQKKMTAEVKDCKQIENLASVSEALKALNDYEIEVASFGQPKQPPLEVDFKDSYHVGVTCFVSSKPRSTSDLHDDKKNGKQSALYNQLCPEMPAEGLFTNPHTLETIKVQDAGYARFWVQFELGKFLLPKFDKNGLELLNPLIVAEAEKIFGIKFVQGCHWSE
jgi:hypothetical protein